SGRILRYRWQGDGLSVVVSFFTVGADALACHVEIPGPPVNQVMLAALVEYHHDLGATGLHQLGLYGREVGQSLLLGGQPSGEVLALGATEAPVVARDWMDRPDKWPAWLNDLAEIADATQPGASHLVPAAEPAAPDRRRV